MSIFHFKQFSVDQTGCAMKVNTDGVLLGALTDGIKAKDILDIGTGTGVITLMLAQRFPDTQINAVELDEAAAQTAERNFKASVFADRLTIHAQSFQDYFTAHPERKFDLIVSNPPFYIQSFQSPQAGKSLAKHAGDRFFKELIKGCSKHLSDNGVLWLILPLLTSTLVKHLAAGNGLFLQQVISIHSYADSDPHRKVLALGKHQTEIIQQRLTIYSEPKVYTDEYRELLKDFLTIF